MQALEVSFNLELAIPGLNTQYGDNIQSKTKINSLSGSYIYGFVAAINTIPADQFSDYPADLIFVNMETSGINVCTGNLITRPVFLLPNPKQYLGGDFFLSVYKSVKPADEIYAFGSIYVIYDESPNEWNNPESIAFLNRLK